VLRRIWITAGLVLASLLAAAAAPSAQAINLAQNGSFETPDVSGMSGKLQYSPSGTGWSFSGGGIQANYGAFGAAVTAYGNQTAFLQGKASIAQSIAFPAAGNYQISFRAAQRACCVSPYAQRIDVSVDGAVIGQAVPSTTDKYTAYTYTFQVTAGAHTVKLASTLTTDNTVFIDAIEVGPAPLLKNGSFEAPALANGGIQYTANGYHWSFFGGGIQANGSPFNAPAAPDGVQTLLLQGAGHISQTVNLADAGNYTLKFKAAQRACCVTPYAQSINVIVDGATVAQVTPTSTNSFTAYSFPLQLSAGNHSIKLASTLSTDNTVYVDAVTLTGVPAVSLTAPANNSAHSSSNAVVLTAAASEPGGKIAKVEFYSGTTLLGVAMQEPYTVNANLAPGSYSVTAKATDWEGVAVSSAPAAIQVYGPPTINLTGPTTQLIAPATVNLSATAASSGTANPITQVAFHDGTSLLGSTSVAPYAFNWTNVGAGTYSVTATATDSVGGTATSRAVEVRVISNVAPTVSMAANPEMATAPATITLTADAADSDGSIERVEFYHGTTLLGSVTQAPYSYTWSNVASGTYTVTAKAVDNAGAVTVSSPVTVRVAGAAARVYYIDSDQLNTPRLITDGNNQVVWKWGNDDPFGANLPEEDPSGLGIFTYNPRFAGQYFDKETGLHYNYFRDYDPGTGRYIQSDPIGLAAGPNTYAYVLGNPLRWIDPLGLANGPAINPNLPRRPTSKPKASSNQCSCPPEQQYSVGISGTVGGSPVGPGLFGGGGISVGVTSNGNVFIQAQATGSAGLGAYVGVGVQGGVSQSTNPTATGMSVSHSGQADVNVGWGGSVGATVQGNASEGSIGAQTGVPGLGRVGIGVGVQASIGITQTVTIASPPLFPNKDCP